MAGSVIVLKNSNKFLNSTCLTTNLKPTILFDSCSFGLSCLVRMGEVAEDDDIYKYMAKVNQRS